MTYFSVTMPVFQHSENDIASFKMIVSQFYVLGIILNEVAGTLTVRLQNMTSRIHDAAVRHLCKELNDTETVYPGTNLQLVYEMVSS